MPSAEGAQYDSIQRVEFAQKWLMPAPKARNMTAFFSESSLHKVVNASAEGARYDSIKFQ